MQIYLDNCATTQVCPEGAEACRNAMLVDYGNPSSLHKMGVAAEQLITGTRKIVAGLLRCDQDSIIFTSGATESNNIAILGGAAARGRAGKTIVTTAVEHPSVEEACARLGEQGYRIKRVAPQSDGNFTAESILEALDQDTILLTFMMVNNEIGTVLPYSQVIPAAKRKFPKLLIHMDGVQGFTKFPLNLKTLDLDLFSFSGHKLYAPKGVGGLYVKKGLHISPVIYGGGQERKLRSGTQSVPLIAALGEALSLCEKNGKQYMEHYRLLNGRLRELLQNRPEILINSPENGAPYLINFSVPGIPSEIMLHSLEQQEIYISSGSACSKGALSSVLAAYGLSKDRIGSAIRVSFSKDTTLEQLDIFYTVLCEQIDRLKRVMKR